MSKSLEEIQARMVVVATGTYTEPSERAALRCAMGDAAALCDAIARRVLEANCTRGRVTNVGQALAAVATQCGDEIAKMRDKIIVPRETSEPQ
jgi:hypothetical protein